MKRFSKLKRIIAIALVITILSTSFAIFASAKTVYYPTSGSASGYFYSSTSSKATFNLSAGIYHLVYVLDSDKTAEIRFQYGSGYTSYILAGDHVCRDITITLPYSGTYTVYLYVKNPTSYEKVYSYNIYSA